MKQKLKSALSLLLCMIMVFGAVAVGGEGIKPVDIKGLFGSEAQAAGDSVGDIIEFGSYPQSKVTDSSTLSALNRKNPS